MVTLDAESGEPVDEVVLDGPSAANEDRVAISTGKTPKPDGRSYRPIYADGMLVCPTPQGRFTAVDLVTRKIVWTYYADLTNQLSAYWCSGRPVGARCDAWSPTLNGIGSKRSPPKVAFCLPAPAATSPA